MNYHLTAQEIMQTEIASISGNASVREAVLAMRYNGTRSLLVFLSDDTKTYGIISYTDVVHKVLAEGKDASQVLVRSIATIPAHTILADTTIQYIAQVFREHNIGHAPVLDEKHRVIGVVSMTDLITEGISEPE